MLLLVGPPCVFPPQITAPVADAERDARCRRSAAFSLRYFWKRGADVWTEQLIGYRLLAWTEGSRGGAANAELSLADF